MKQLLAILAVCLGGWVPAGAHAAYWNVFNVEGESTLSAQVATYASLADMLDDTNRTGVHTPNPSGFGTNIVDSGSDGQTYWNLFNVEGESTLSAQFVTYGTLADMLGDANRTGIYTPNPSSFGPNIVGSGSDGTSYWSVFNVEAESVLSAQIVTYGTLQDMLGDTNRLGVFTPNPSGFGPNIVDSGSDGSTYWNLFNIEGEQLLSAQIVTYATLADMLGDVNRTGIHTPNPASFGTNIVGSGSDAMADPQTPVPEPGALALVALGLGLLWRQARR